MSAGSARALREGGGGTIYATTYRHDALGELTVASDGVAIVGLWMARQKYFGSRLPQPFARNDSLPALVQARSWLDRYFAGVQSDPLELPLAPRGTAFQRRVWKILAQIPYGSLRTYADIADQIAREDGTRCSARAVGAANGKTPSASSCRAIASSVRTAASPATPAALSASSGCSDMKGSTSAS